MSLSSLSPLFSRAHGDGGGGDLVVDGDGATTTEEGEKVTKEFNLPVFASLMEKVVGHGETQSIQILARLKARWMARYGSTDSRAQSSVIGSMMEAGSSLIRLIQGMDGSD
ncbi:hypothetical protein Salat_0508200 [Sesamum alatum]|uniref:Uncharacterized protein n=1 Tax=Sesamum alatum TaxID=300844 RepID=A0AAE1Z5E2_9LAMI|nr:hypothetical protein Salat_0508200 [Sesamum alatum]